MGAEPPAGCRWPNASGSGLPLATDVRSSYPSWTSVMNTCLHMTSGRHLLGLFEMFRWNCHMWSWHDDDPVCQAYVGISTCNILRHWISPFSVDGFSTCTKRSSRNIVCRSVYAFIEVTSHEKCCPAEWRVVYLHQRTSTKWEFDKLTLQLVLHFAFGFAAWSHSHLHVCVGTFVYMCVINADVDCNLQYLNTLIVFSYLHKYFHHGKSSRCRTSVRICRCVFEQYALVWMHMQITCAAFMNYFRSDYSDSLMGVTLSTFLVFWFLPMMSPLLLLHLIFTFLFFLLPPCPLLPSRSLLLLGAQAS